MKNFKFLLVMCISFFSFQQASAQLDSTFYIQDSCHLNTSYFIFSASTPGYSAYYYDFGDGSSDTITNQIGQTSHTYNSPGNYTVSLTVYDNGVNSSSSQSITVYPINQVAFSYNYQSNLCDQPQIVDFNAIESNPNNPIVSWDWYVAGQYAGNGNILTYTFNTSGIYDVGLYALTTSGCHTEWVETITITQSNLTANASHQIISSNCNGSIVDLYSTVSGGTAPYTYLWNDLNGNTYTTANPQQVTLDANFGGLINLNVLDANGCSTTTSDSIIAPQNNISTASTNTPTNGCGQTCDGSITVSATGTAGPYTFILIPGNQTQTGNQANFTNLCQGSYQIEVFDQNQCSTLVQEYVDQDSSSQIIVDALLSGGNACDTFICNGEAEIFVTNGVAPYQYSLDGGQTFQTSNIFDSLCPSTYQILVEDANGCTGFYSFSIGNQSLGAQSSVYYANCDSNNQGNTSFINLYPYGGQAPYSFSWSDSSTTSSINNPTPNTDYSVIVTDANGCTYAETFNVPDNNCYSISGNVYVDVNENCIYDSSDYPIQTFVDLTATAGGAWLWIYDYTDADGHFEILADSGTYFFDINGSNTNNLTQNCPGVNYSVTLGANNPNPTVDFFLSPPTPVQDLSVSIGHITNVAPSTIPSHNRWSYINFCNDGTIPMSGNVVWNYSEELFYAGPGYTNIIPDVIDTAAHSLTFNFVNLLPGECKYIRINFDVPNTMQIGTVINDEATINPIAGDITPSNNVAYTSELSEGSWDPNDKAVFPNGDITVDDNDHHYHIRFQNEGNANATRVIVKDELDMNLDLHSLRNVSASHDYILTIENDNELVFTFNNIQLPPKDVNEEASQGFVTFTLSQDGELPIGTKIENTAAIYFDFNPAITTNTVLNTIVAKTTSISDLAIENAVSIYPNPSNGVFNIDIAKNLDPTSIKVYDVLGNLYLIMPNLKNNQIQVNLQNNSNGIYFVEITTTQGTTVQKIFKNNK